MNKKQKAIICDIDGFLLDTYAIMQEAQKQATVTEKWHYFEKYANDREKVAFNNTLGELLKALHGAGYEIIYSTARSVKIKLDTMIRLRDELGFIGALYMRGKNDLRQPAEIKAEHLIHIRQYYDPQIAIDDEDENIKMFAENGLLVMKLSINQKKGG